MNIVMSRSIWLGVVFAFVMFSSGRCDPAADLLTRAQSASDAGKYAEAARDFRAFLDQFPTHAQASAARFGLGKSLLRSGGDYQEAATQLGRISDKELAFYPAALVYRGLAERALGLAANEKKRAAHFHTASVALTDASALFSARAKEADREWATFARCALADVYLRTGRNKEAADITAALRRDPALERSRFRGLVHYYHGVACFLCQEFSAAGGSLNSAATEEAPFAAHARYLLARVFHETDEHAEALGQYQRVLADETAERARIAQALAQTNAPADKARLQALSVRPPAYVCLAELQAARLLCERSRFDDARTLFSQFAAHSPRTPLATEARLLAAVCDLRLGQQAAAVGTLEDIAAHQPALSKRALLWLGRAHLGAASDTSDADERVDALDRAADCLRRAAAGENLDNAAARQLHGEVLLDLAEAHTKAGRFQEASTFLERIAREKLLPGRGEELLQRRLSALNLAGDYAGSEKLVELFRKDHPNSILLSEVLFRHAENMHFLQRSAKTKPEPKDNEAYQAVILRSPDSGQANLARFAQALNAYRRGEWEPARKLVEDIPAPDLTGDVAAASFVLADCLIRLAPAQADDALAAGRLQEQLGNAAALLEGFAAENPDSPLAPEALLRLGICRQRLAALLPEGDERNKAYQAARSAYERVLAEYSQNEAGPFAAVGRARCLLAAGGEGSGEQAVRTLRRFASPPLRDHSAAPLALLVLATRLRAEDKLGEAARIMVVVQRHGEPGLVKDPKRASWLPLLQLHRGIALKEAGRHVEARAIFEHLQKRFPDRPEAFAAVLRWGQSSFEEANQMIEQGNQLLGQAQGKPAETEAANRIIAAGQKQMETALAYYETRAGQGKDAPAAASARPLLLYDAAWLRRGRAEQEVEAARATLRDKRKAELQAQAAKTTPEGQPVPEVPVPEVPLEEVPLQPSEKAARKHYEELFNAFPDLPLTAGARLELAELEFQRGRHASAVEILEQALEKEPPEELADRVRLRLGECILARGDARAALAQFKTVMERQGSPHAPRGRLRAAEVLVRLGQWSAASDLLVPFRDQEPLQNIGGVSDVGLLRLGHALLRLKKEEEAKQAFRLVWERFGDGGWAPEARYGYAWARQQQLRHETAREGYQQAIGEAATETAARAQFQVGACLIELGKYAEAGDILRAMPAKYPFADLNALALLEAAHALRQLKKTDEAEQLFHQVLKDFPKSRWTPMAQELKRAATPPHRLPAVMDALAPERIQPPALEPLGSQQSTRASLDDPTDEPFQGLVLARTPPRRGMPFLSPAIEVPDPFERRRLFKLTTPLPDESVPVLDLIKFDLR
jgi:TolA-binding protein